MLWSWNVFAPGWWFHPSLQHRDEILPGQTHFSSKSWDHLQVKNQSPRWKSSLDEITHVNRALRQKEKQLCIKNWVERHVWVLFVCLFCCSLEIIVYRKVIQTCIHNMLSHKTPQERNENSDTCHFFICIFPAKIINISFLIRVHKLQ